MGTMDEFLMLYAGPLPSELQIHKCNSTLNWNLSTVLLIPHLTL